MGNERHISLRADSSILDKFYYISKYYGRSGSAQILYQMRMLIEDFEREHGKISDEDIKNMYGNK